MQGATYNNILRYIGRHENHIYMKFLVDGHFKVTLLCDNVNCGTYDIDAKCDDIFDSHWIGHPDVFSAKVITLIFNDSFSFYIDSQPNTSFSFSMDRVWSDFPYASNEFSSVFNSFIDKVYYINLDQRIDRNDNMQRQLERLKVDKNKIHRFSAHKTENPYIGCSMSHKDVIVHAKENGYKNIFVLEDDYQVRDLSLFEKQFIGFVNTRMDYDVFMMDAYLSSWNETEYDGIVRVLEATLASAYIVNESIFDDLIKVFDDSVNKLSQGYVLDYYTTDKIWLGLQKNKKWYGVRENAGYQLLGYSDLIKTTR